MHPQPLPKLHALVPGWHGGPHFSLGLQNKLPVKDQRTRWLSCILPNPIPPHSVPKWSDSCPQCRTVTMATTVNTSEQDRTRMATCDTPVLSLCTAVEATIQRQIQGSGRYPPSAGCLGNLTRL